MVIFLIAIGERIVDEEILSLIRNKFKLIRRQLFEVNQEIGGWRSFS